MNDTCDIADRHCLPCEGGVPPLTPSEAATLLQDLDGWEMIDGAIARTCRFKNYYQTMAFVNAVAWISHREDHHPDLAVGYAECTVRYSTHAIGGLSDNDFICAAKVNRLFTS